MNDPVNYVDLWGLYVTESDMPGLDDGNSGLQEEDSLPPAQEKSGINWGQVGASTIDLVVGGLGIWGSASAIGGSGGAALNVGAGAALLASIREAAYGLAGIVIGFTGGELPPSLAFLAKFSSYGLTDVPGWDKQKQKGD